MKLVRDVLDQRVLDRDRHLVGRVDEVVLQLTDCAPPRVIHIEMGATALGERLGRIGRWLARHALPHENDPRSGPRQPFRIAWGDVRELENTEVVADLDAECSRAHRWERWLADHVIGRIPGA